MTGASGTDRSQQNAVQTAFTDLVIGVVTTELTSVLNPFGATDVGNLIAITSGTGFTTGIYRVVSVAGSTATMDRAVGTASSTGGVGNLGGARLGIEGGTTTLSDSVVAGNKIWIKNEAWNEAVTISVAGTAADPIIWTGYNSTRDDKPAAADRPVNNRAAAAGDGISISVTHNILQYINVTAAGDAGFNMAASAVFRFENCKS